MITEPTEFTDLLRSHGKQVGVDFLGIAPIMRFADLPAEKHPASIFPEVQSVLIVGKRITRGALRGIEEGTQFDIYGQYGRDWLNNRVLATATFRTAEFLEDNGWEAVPLQNLPPETPPMGVPVREGRPAPNVMLDFDDAAVRSGVAEMGQCGLLLTPQFGPRQRLQMILTDAVLTPNGPLECPVCLHCKDVDTICPLHAIKVQDASGPSAAIDYSTCAKCKNGAFTNNLHPSGKPDRFAALCARNCLTRLEESGRISNTFHQPFRTRSPWGLVEEVTRL